MAEGDVCGVVLAGGRSVRMGGGDKPLRQLAGRPLMAHVVDRLAPQVAALVVNANGDPGRYAAFAAPVVPDALPGLPGPLAGIHAGMQHAAGRYGRLVTVPGDSPFLPADLVARLHAAAAGADRIVVARSAGGAHPVVASWPAALAPAMRDFLLTTGDFSVRAFLAIQDVDYVDFPPVTLPGGPADPFFNVNTPADLDAASRLLAGEAAP